MKENSKIFKISWTKKFWIHFLCLFHSASKGCGFFFYSRSTDVLRKGPPLNEMRSIHLAYEWVLMHKYKCDMCTRMTFAQAGYSRKKTKQKTSDLYWTFPALFLKVRFIPSGWRQLEKRHRHHQLHPPSCHFGRSGGARVAKLGNLRVRRWRRNAEQKRNQQKYRRFH